QGPGPNAGPGNAPRQQQVPKAILDHIAQLPWASFPIPPTVGPEQSAKYIQNIKQRYIQSLMTMEQLKTRIQRLDRHVKEKEERGQPLSPEDLKKITEQKEADTRNHAESHKFVQSVRNQLNQGGNRNAQGQGNAQQGRPQSGSAPGQNNPA